MLHPHFTSFKWALDVSYTPPEKNQTSFHLYFYLHDPSISAVITYYNIKWNF